MEVISFGRRIFKGHKRIGDSQVDGIDFGGSGIINDILGFRPLKKACVLNLGKTVQVDNFQWFPIISLRVISP